MNTQKKVFLFIDGSNLYSAQYELFSPYSYLNFPIFISSLEGLLKVQFNRIYFYTSYSPKPNKPTHKQKSYLKNEALFYRSVKMTKHIIFFKGYRSPTSGKEKEVDVKLTADLIHLAHIDSYDESYLMSGDADFLQALFIVNSIGKKVNILCLENKIMFKGIYRFPTRIIRLSKEMVKYNKTRLVSEIYLEKKEVSKNIL